MTMISSPRSIQLHAQTSEPISDSGPTPETRSKLRQDVLYRLTRNGRIEQQHLMAGEEIRNAWDAVGRGLFPSARRLDALPGHSTRRAFLDPIDRMRPNEEKLWRTRYRPWASEMSVTIVSAISRITRLQLVHDIVIDNSGLRMVEHSYQLKHGRALMHLRAALDRYCVIAGWT